MTSFTHRPALSADLPVLRSLMASAIERLQDGFLDADQVRASHRVMGLDTQLIEDRTYLVVEDGGTIVGCGGWSFRATLFGGDASIVARTPDPLDPATDAARIRAMYTRPDRARQGIGRLILGLCEQAARDHGFARAELMATLAGEPLYRACGYRTLEPFLSDPIDGVQVPMIRMGKPL